MSTAVVLVALSLIVGVSVLFFVGMACSSPTEDSEQDEAAAAAAGAAAAAAGAAVVITIANQP